MCGDANFQAATCAGEAPQTNASRRARLTFAVTFFTPESNVRKSGSGEGDTAAADAAARKKASSIKTSVVSIAPKITRKLMPRRQSVAKCNTPVVGNLRPRPFFLSRFHAQDKYSQARDRAQTMKHHITD